MMKMMSITGAMAFAIGMILSLSFETSVVTVIPLALSGLAIEMAYIAWTLYGAQPQDTARTERIRQLAAIACN